MEILKKKNINDLSDISIVQYYKDTKDKNGVGVLFDRYAHLVYGTCLNYLKNRDESHDMTMMIFEKLLNELFLHEITNFKGWLYMVTRNQCLMFLRKNNKITNKVRIETSELEADISEPIDLEQLSEAKLQKLQEAIDELNPQQKTCVSLFYLEKKCYKEICEITGFSLNKVKSAIQNGKRNIKNQLLRFPEFAKKPNEKSIR